MEIFGYHPELRKWTELGNSGMVSTLFLYTCGVLFHVEWCTRLDSSGVLQPYTKTTLASPMT